MFLGSMFMAGEAFRTRIVELRNAHHLSQEELAQAVGVTKGAVQGWEAGTSMPRGGHLALIGETFPDFTTDYLLGLTDARSTSPGAAAASDRTAARERGLDEAEGLERPKTRPRRSKRAG